MSDLAIHWPSALLLLLALYCVLEFAANLRLSRAGRRAAKTQGRLRVLASDLQDPQHDSDEASIVRKRLGSGERVRQIAWIETMRLFRGLDLLLYRAGWSVRIWRFLAGTLAAALLAGGVVLQLTFDWTQALAAAVFVGVLPFLVALRRKRARMRLFELQFPEALELICRALRAGHALSAGIRMVADELDAPLSTEFAQVADEIALGMETREALANLAHRVDVPDLGFFGTAVLIQRETGGNLTEVMDRLAHVIRERHTFYGKVQALTAQNRGAALILLFTPPGFLLLMHQVSPGFIEPIFTTDAGHMLAWVAAGLTIAGYTLARRLAVVKA